MKKIKCSFCNKEAASNMQGMCQTCYRYFVVEGKGVYPLPQYGVVEHTPSGDCICHECGKAFRKLGQHVYYAHDMTSKQYAAMHGLKLRGPGMVRLSNEIYSAHMRDVQNPKTISTNLLENGKGTRFNAVNGNQKQLPNHTVKQRCFNCLWFDIDTELCNSAKTSAKLVMQCPVLNTKIPKKRRKINMLFQGEILSAIPCKGYAFIRPIWAKETDGSSKNIYCYYASDREKNSRRCFINILDKAHPELHVVKKNKRGEEIFLPVDKPQTIWFEAVLQNYNGNYKLMAINLVDEKHITDEERAEAEKNVTEPDFTDEHSLVVSQPVENDSYINAILMSMRSSQVEEVATNEETSLLPMVIQTMSVITEEQCSVSEIIYPETSNEEYSIEEDEESYSYSEESEELEAEFNDDKYSDYCDDYDCCNFVKNKSKKLANPYKGKGHQSKHGKKFNICSYDKEED